MPDTVHFVVIVFQNIGGALDGNKLKTKISDFNNTNYSNKALILQDYMLDHRMKIFVIRELANKADAMAYHSHLYDNDEVYGNVNPAEYKQFVISANNLAEIFKQKKTDEYEEFFRQFYK